MSNILLVLPTRNLGNAQASDPQLGYAHGIISTLSRTSELTILLSSIADIKKYEHFLCKRTGSMLRVVALPEVNHEGFNCEDLRLNDFRPFVRQSVRIYNYLIESEYDCVIFDIFDAPGFVPARAKKTGIGLQKSLLVGWLRTCHEFQRDQLLEPPHCCNNFILEQELAFAEKYCCERCDLVISHTDAILEWTVKREWTIDRKKVVPLTCLEAGRSLWSFTGKSVEIEHRQNQDPCHWKTQPLVSVCVAHFNDGENLRYLLKSIEDNDYKNFEVIVVDDGSTDIESLRVFRSLSEEYPSDSWRFIAKKENESLGPTRNFAVSLARGEFVLFMDSDDLAANTLISDLVNGMLTSGSDCLTCPLAYFEGDGGKVDSNSIFKFWMPLGASIEIGIYDNPFGAANFCIKKSVFEALEGFCSPRGEVSEDWEFLARLVLAGFDMDVIPKPLYFYRVRPDSWIQTAWSQNSIQNLRRRILSCFRPQHTRIMHDMLLRTIAENKRLRASLWKLDRKVVKIALRVSEIISEEHRLLIEDFSIGLFKRCKDALSPTSRFLREKVNLLYNAFNTMIPIRPEMRGCLSESREVMLQSLRFPVKTLSDSQRMEIQMRLGLPLGRPIFGYVGILNKENRPLGFLRLAYWMQMFKDNSLFVMVGDGALQEEVQATAIKYKLSNFRWVASIESQKEFYFILSGLVITSLPGQDPNVMLEALACGIPVFSTDFGQATWVLGDYGSGLVVNYDPERKDFADCFKLWKDNLEVYRAAAIETAELIRMRF